MAEFTVQLSPGAEPITITGDVQLYNSKTLLSVGEKSFRVINGVIINQFSLERKTEFKLWYVEVKFPKSATKVTTVHGVEWSVVEADPNKMTAMFSGHGKIITLDITKEGNEYVVRTPFKLTRRTPSQTPTQTPSYSSPDYDERYDGPNAHLFESFENSRNNTPRKDPPEHPHKNSHM